MPAWDRQAPCATQRQGRHRNTAGLSILPASGVRCNGAGRPGATRPSPTMRPSAGHRRPRPVPRAPEPSSTGCPVPASSSSGSAWPPACGWGPVMRCTASRTPCRRRTTTRTRAPAVAWVITSNPISTTPRFTANNAACSPRWMAPRRVRHQRRWQCRRGPRPGRRASCRDALSLSPPTRPGLRRPGPDRHRGRQRPASPVPALWRQCRRSFETVLFTCLVRAPDGAGASLFGASFS